MQRGGYLYGKGDGNGSGFQYGRGQPYRPPVPPEQHQQMTPPQERQAVLMAAGRLAAEYLVNRGDLPPNVLENRPTALNPSLGVGGQHAFGSQHQPPPVARPFHFQGRPPAPPQQRQPQAWPHPFPFQGQHQRPPAPQRRFPGPRPFQAGRGPFPKRPRQRPFPYGPHGPAPPQTRHAGQAAAAAASKSKQDDDNEHSAPAGEAGHSQPTAQPDVLASGSQQTNEPPPTPSSTLGANASESN